MDPEETDSDSRTSSLLKRHTTGSAMFGCPLGGGVGRCSQPRFKMSEDLAFYTRLTLCSGSSEVAQGGLCKPEFETSARLARASCFEMRGLYRVRYFRIIKVITIAASIPSNST